MDIALLIARLVLAAAFAIAAGAKLLGRGETGRMMTAFGVPRGLAPTVARVLPADRAARRRQRSVLAGRR